MTVMWFVPVLGIVLMLALIGCDERSSPSAPAPPSTSTSTTMTAGMSAYEYLAADGGPHMLLPAEAASAWSGASSMLAVVNPKSDYGRACAATAATRIVLIPVGSASAIVFANPPMTAWGKSADGLVEVYYLEAWTGTNLDALISKATASLTTASMSDSGKVLQLHEADAYLLFAGDTPSSTAYGVHRVPISAGKYNVLEGTYSGGGISYRLPAETVGCAECCGEGREVAASASPFFCPAAERRSVMWLWI
jgi:hypothetical protein